MAETDEDLPVPTHDGAIADLVKSLINGEVAASKDAYGDTPRARLRNHMKVRADDTVMGSIAGLSAYLTARAAERQATAMESMAKTVRSTAMVETVDSTAQAMVDLREPKYEYLSTTYSLSTEMLSLLWSLRGMLMDASVKSLSKPEQFEPYRQLTTEDLAWGLRMSPATLWSLLPRTPDRSIDYGLLEDFGIMHYGGTDQEPDVWLFGG